MTAFVVRYRPDEYVRGLAGRGTTTGYGADNACRLHSTLDGFAQEAKFAMCVVPTRISSDQHDIRHRLPNGHQ
ncbi:MULTISPECIES: hypothetical protein [unclassified Burkholderia]|uniref:hypothetical protein n=1 Tax=unclassified Burkholderia TaxID=2613784 RepID=UPI000F572773|nr:MULTISPECIES: hypothetical protein [unclassified Burkholderia]